MARKVMWPLVLIVLGDCRCKNSKDSKEEKRVLKRLQTTKFLNKKQIQPFLENKI